MSQTGMPCVLEHARRDRRTEERGSSNNFKRWHPIDALTKTHADEYETKVDDVEAIRRTLEALDVPPLITVDKTREEWKLPDIEVVFDHVVDAGDFVEFEFEADAATVEDATEQLEQFVASLNVELGEPINRGYPHILLGPQALTIHRGRATESRSCARAGSAPHHPPGQTIRTWTATTPRRPVTHVDRTSPDLIPMDRREALTGRHPAHIRARFGPARVAAEVGFRALYDVQRRCVVFTMVGIVGRAANEAQLPVMIHLAWNESDAAIDEIDASGFAIVVPRVGGHEPAAGRQLHGAWTDQPLQILAKASLMSTAEVEVPRAARPRPRVPGT